MSWHADTRLLDHYAAGSLASADAASLEAHLLACPQCRQGLAPRVDPRRLAATWTAIDAALDAPRPGPVERLLCRLGVSDHLARLLASTPSLRTSWLTAVALALAFAVVAAYGGTGEQALLVFLVVAPLLPLAGVAAAFTPSVDPAAEVALAAPMRTFRLLLVRAAAVLVPTLILTSLAALTLPGPGWAATAWLLPSVALAVSALALSTYVSPAPAAAAVALLWVAGVVASEVVASGGLAGLRLGGSIESDLFRAAGQLGFGMASAAAAAVLANRRHVFEIGRTA